MINRLASSITPRLADQRGIILLSAMLGISFLMVVGISLLSATTTQRSATTANTFEANALLVAEAGIEESLESLNEDANFAGYGTAQQLFSDPVQGIGSYTTTVAAGAGTSKTITSVGRVYRYNQPTKLVKIKIVKVTVVGTSSPGYSVHTGPGGLILGGSASITNADVYVNGTLTLGGASKIGTNAQPLSVYVAHQACPTGSSPGPTYPTVCGSGQPISLAHSTAIYGSVCATNQTSTGPNNNIKTGNGGTGLQPGCVAPPVTTPTYDRAAHIAAVTTTGSATSNTYVCNSWPFTRTWPANLRLNGNVNIGGSCDITITGDTYITGNLDLGGASKITVSNSVGTTRPVVIVDGNITVGGSSSIVANSSGTGIQFISFKSSASCNPNCTSVTGTDLKTSSGVTTVTVGGAANLPGMIFQSYWGKIVLNGSGNLGSAIGQTVDLSGAGTITFGTSLSAGSTTWTISSYQQKFPKDVGL